MVFYDSKTVHIWTGDDSGGGRVQELEGLHSVWEDAETLNCSGIWDKLMEQSLWCFWIMDMRIEAEAWPVLTDADVAL